MLPGFLVFTQPYINGQTKTAASISLLPNCLQLVYSYG